MICTHVRYYSIHVLISASKRVLIYGASDFEHNLELIQKLNFNFVNLFALISSRQIKDVIFSHLMETFRLFNFIELTLEPMCVWLTMALEIPFSVKSS